MNIWFKNNRKVLLISPILFCCFLAWFYWGNHWYPASTLYITGTVSDLPAEIGVRLESGHGLNGYEYQRYTLQPLPNFNSEKGISLIITRPGVRNSASLESKVVLRNIYIDDKKYIPAEELLSQGVKLKNDELFFKKEGAELRLMIKPTSSVRLEFPVHNRAGKVDVRLGDKTTRYDLYSPQQETQWDGIAVKRINTWFVDENGRFTISMSMPRYRVNTLRVDSKNDFSLVSQTIQTEDFQELQPEGFEYRKGINFPMSGISDQLERHFHPHRFLFQIVFALLSAWLLSYMLVFVGRFNGIKDIFIHEKRYLFWMMLFLSSVLFSFWHVSFWPGVTSNDSLEVWRAAQIPGMYLGDHPPLNVLFYLFLSQFWNNVAIVPIVQNVLTSLLIAYIFFSLYRKGLPLYLLLPCYGMIAFSLPVGLYTIVLWKDVPFALITVFLGFKLASYYFNKQTKSIHISWRSWLTIICLTLLLVGLRHNGILYLAIVPFIVIIFGIARIRPRVLSALLVLFVLLGTIFISTPVGSKTSGYLVKQTRTYLSQAMDRLSFSYVENSAKKYLGVFDVNQTNMQWDLVHLCMYGRYSNDFLKNVRWNDVYPYLPMPKGDLVKKMRGVAWDLYWKSYQKPWVYFSWNPFYMLILLPLLPLFFRVLPMTAVFSLFVIIPVSVLVFLNIFNWRYYYFAFLGSYFLLPLIATDYYAKKNRHDICV